MEQTQKSQLTPEQEKFQKEYKKSKDNFKKAINGVSLVQHNTLAALRKPHKENMGDMQREKELARFAIFQLLVAYATFRKTHGGYTKEVPKRKGYEVPVSNISKLIKQYAVLTTVKL